MPWPCMPPVRCTYVCTTSAAAEAAQETWCARQLQVYERAKETAVHSR
jgi:hypothetical protein